MNAELCAYIGWVLKKTPRKNPVQLINTPLHPRHATPSSSPLSSPPSTPGTPDYSLPPTPDETPFAPAQLRRRPTSDVRPPLVGLPTDERVRIAWASPPPLEPHPGSQGTQFALSFGDDSHRIRRAQHLEFRASGVVHQLELGEEAPPVGGEPIDAQELLLIYQQMVPSQCLGDHERALSALEVLVEARVQPKQLQELVARGQFRDAWRAVVSAELTYALSFGAATLTAHQLAPQPGVTANGPLAPEPAPAPALDATARFMVAGAIIGVGGEVAQAIVREGQTGPRYNALLEPSAGERSPFADTRAGKIVQYASAVPFGVLYAADDVARQFFQTRPALRLAAGAGAAALSALFKFRGAAWGGAQQDPTWLDASTPDKRIAMLAAIQSLRQGSWEAAQGYCINHLGPGLAASAGEVVSEKGLIRSLTRMAAATLARAGSVLAEASGLSANLYVQLASDAWLGLSWGALSTWPQSLLDGAALQRAKEAGAPVVARASAKSIAPPLMAPASIAPMAPR